MVVFLVFLRFSPRFSQSQSSSFFRGGRGQASIEYVFILALVLGFVLALMISGMRESELNLAVGAARSACVEWTAKNPSQSVYLASMPVAQSGRSANFTPVVYYWGGNRLTPLPDDLKKAVIAAVQKSVAPSAPLAASNCFSSVNFDYCVVDAAEGAA